MKRSWIDNFYPSGWFTQQSNGTIQLNSAKNDISTNSAIQSVIAQSLNTDQEGGFKNGKYFLKKNLSNKSLENALLSLVNNFFANEKSLNKFSNKDIVFFVKNNKDNGIGFFTNNLSQLKKNIKN